MANHSLKKSGDLANTGGEKKVDKRKDGGKLSL